MNRRELSWDDAYLVHIAKVTNLRHGCYFIATNDDHVWRDTPNESAVTAVYKADETIAETIPHEHVSHVSWTSVQIKPRFEARIKGTEETSTGETPGRAVQHLNFDDTYQVDRPPVTEATTFEQQVEDILRSLNGAVHVETIPNYANMEMLDEQVPENVQQSLLDIENTTNIYRTRGDDPKWWSAR